MSAYTSYESYAYHISMLRQFVSLSSSRAKNDINQNTLDTSVHGGNVWNTFKRSRINLNGGGRWSRDIDDSASTRGIDASVKSLPGRGIRRINTTAGALR